MKFRLLLTALLVVASATSALAVGPYVGAGVGVSIVHDSDVRVLGFTGTATANYDTGFGFNLSGGYNFDPVRIEGEFGYKKASVNKISGPGGSVNINDTDITVMSYMFNGYYDIKTQSAITPFIGAGLGILHGEFSEPGDNTDDTSFGYQFSVGAAYKVNKNVDLDLSYRFQGAASDFAKNGVSISYHSSNIFGGIRYNF